MGGWDTTLTQDTVIHPSTVGQALEVMQQFVADFNKFLREKNIPEVKIGSPLGSSSHYLKDLPTKVYGDIDLQIIVEDLPVLEGKTMSQIQSYWYKLEDEFVNTCDLGYVSVVSTPGHPIIDVGDGWVQVDMIIHPERISTWGRFRTTPEQGIKGLLHGNMFSVLGELLTMSIQHSGVQYKLRNGIKQPYKTTRKDYELVTLTTDIETFVYDIFMHLAKEQNITDPKVDQMLIDHPGNDCANIKIENLVKAIVGLGRSCELNGMFGHGDLIKYTNTKDFIDAFALLYIKKANADLTSSKRDKATTPLALQRAEQDRDNVTQGLYNVLGKFYEII